jgi:RsiW-degrading membrane proteinase PrsW (M82 family)
MGGLTMNTAMVTAQNLSLWLWSVGPSIAIISFIYFFDKFKEPKSVVLTTFLLGYGLIFFLDPLIIFTEGVINYFDFGYPEKEFYFNYIRAAFLEETCKLLILYYYCTRQSAFNERMDAIVYGVTVSLGFSAMENIDYIFNPLMGENIIYIRILPTIMHASTGAVMGLILSGFLIKNVPTLFRIILALFIPIIIHGTYNLMWGLGHIIIGNVVVFGLILSTSIILYKQREIQKYKKIEEEDLIKHPNYYMGYSIFINLITVIIFSIALSNFYSFFYYKIDDHWNDSLYDEDSLNFDNLIDEIYEKTDSYSSQDLKTTHDLIGKVVYNPNSKCTVFFDSAIEAYSECFKNLYEPIFIGEDNYLYIGPYETSYDNEGKIEEAYIVENGQIISWFKNENQSEWTKDNETSSLR